MSELKNYLFSEDGHVSKWVFFPPAWGGDDGHWCEGFSEDEKKELFEHMKTCHLCRKAEIEATLHWAEHRPRASTSERIGMQAENNDQIPPADLVLEKYPIYLLDHLLQFCKGKIIKVHRDNKGSVQRITGLIESQLESDITFIYEDGSTSIHCYCHNCEDDPIITMEKMTFADFHIDHRKNNEINFSLDITDFYPECNEIKRFHTYHKLFTDKYGNIVKIIQDKKPWYNAEFNDHHKITSKSIGTLKTDYQYNNNQLVLKTCNSENELIEQNTFEYAENQPGPVRMFNKGDSDLQLVALNSFCESADEAIQTAFEFDGVARYYYNNSGNLILKVHLPHDKNRMDENMTVDQIHELQDMVTTIEMFIIDTKSGSMRVIQKKEGVKILDQTSIFENGLLMKVYNNLEAINNTLQSIHFANKHWSNIIEIDDQNFINSQGV